MQPQVSSNPAPSEAMGSTPGFHWASSASAAGVSSAEKNCQFKLNFTSIFLGTTEFKICMCISTEVQFTMWWLQCFCFSCWLVVEICCISSGPSQNQNSNEKTYVTSLDWHKNGMVSFSSLEQSVAHTPWLLTDPMWPLGWNSIHRSVQSKIMNVHKFKKWYLLDPNSQVA